MPTHVPPVTITSVSYNNGIGTGPLLFSTYANNVHHKKTSSSAMAERPRELSDFKGMGHFDAKFYMEVLHFMTISMAY